MTSQVTIQHVNNTKNQNKLRTEKLKGIAWSQMFYKSGRYTEDLTLSFIYRPT
jgi:hypothetical protein